MSIKQQLFLLITILILIPIQTTCFATFTDISSGNKFFVETQYLQEKNIINGYEDGTYKPYEDINRAEALKIFFEANKITESESFKQYEELETNPFPDVSKDAWYAKYVAYAKDKEIINGYSDGNFHPSANINMVEALKIYLESSDAIYPSEFKNHFLDVDENAWYAKYLRFADSRDMLEIYPSNKIYPHADLNRGDIAWLIYRHLKYGQGNIEFGKATFYGKAVQGHYTASGEIFDLNELTAAHKTLPFNTVVKVTNMANGKSVNVRITDRGPYGPGRVIDLTEAAFSEIAWLGTGVIHVELEIVSTP